MQSTPANTTSSTGSTSRQASSVHDVSSEKPPFGARFLTEEADVWSQNAWDHVPPPSDQEEAIATALARQHSNPVPDSDKHKYNDRPARHWDNFYKMNSDNFFRNRKWLHLEFPELLQAARPEAGDFTIAEIGCGAGNAVFPLLSANKNPNLDLLAFDYSAQAVKVVQANPLYTSPPVGTIRSDVWDLSSTSLPPGVSPGTVDIVILVFVMSALHPDEWRQAIANIHQMLKPGGLVAMRDYGRYDLTQLRFKGGRLLEENFYIRGDKTRVYFFELDELALLFTGSLAPSVWKAHPSEIKVEEEGAESENDTPSASKNTLVDSPSSLKQANATPTILDQIKDQPIPEEELADLHPTTTPSPPSIHPSLLHLTETSTPSPSYTHPLFAIEQLGVDRRLIVNRKRQLKMYRVWMQGKFRKLETSS